MIQQCHAMILNHFLSNLNKIIAFFSSIFVHIALVKIKEILEVQLYHIPMKVHNKLQMKLHGNVGVVGVNFTSKERGWIFVTLAASKDERHYGRNLRDQKRLIELYDLKVTINALVRFRVKFEDNDYTFDGVDAPRSGRPMLLSKAGVKKIIKKVTGHTIRSVARSERFRGKKGSLIKVSRQTIQREAKRGGLVVCLPKIRRIQHHHSHHQRARLAHAQYTISQPTVTLNRWWFADEMSWPVSLTPNRKNDVIYTTKELQRTSNVTRVTKGAMHAAFSLIWCIWFGGVAWAHMYVDMLTVKKFAQFLREYHMPAVAKRRRSPYCQELFYHDHVTNSSTFYNKKMMDAVCGRGKWLQFSLPVCREQRGMIKIAAVDTGSRRIKEHERRNMVAKSKCDCDFGVGKFVPSASPDVNIIEMANGYLRQLLWRKVDSGEVKWSGSVKTKMAIIAEIITELNDDNAYFRRLYASLRPRANAIIAADGAVL